MKGVIFAEYLNPARGIYKQAMLSRYNVLHRFVVG